MAEPFFRLLETVLPRLVAINQGPYLTFDGLENIPERGGAVLAFNHTSYLDWYPGSIAVLRRHRRLRFMIKAEMQNVPVIGYVIKHIKLIPVDRSAGAGSYAVAVQQLKAGELIGVHPEATISRSFELKDFKTGAARMAQAADVPLIPVAVWGVQRIWTKEHRSKMLRNKIPVLVKIGAPLHPTGDLDEATGQLHAAMTELLHAAQEEYPHPAGAFWVPRRLGGTAPTLAEAEVMWAAEMAERERKRQELAAGGGPLWRRVAARVRRR